MEGIDASARLLHRGRVLESFTLSWNVVGIVAIGARSVALAAGYRPRHRLLGIAWTAVTAVAMFVPARGKARTGRVLQNPVLQTEGRVTAIGGVLAVPVLAALVLNSALGWWWADPVAAYVLVYYASRESFEIFRGHIAEPG